ncbi:MAG: alpha/beta hydrolase [Candidatus Omnitrophota bacterium]|nr:alpha/beta hydrolase [Candidatus Omnitrophota bacterium]
MVRVIVYILFFVFSMAGYVRSIENSKIFYPTKEIIETPRVLNVEFQDIYIKTSDNIKINGWFIPKPGARYTVLFLHGNGGNMGDRLDKINMFYDIGVNMFIVDYRGYGSSEGKVSEKGVYLDARFCYKYLVDDFKIAPEHILVYGESLGAAIAIDLVSNVEVAALITEGAFTSIKEVGKTVHPFLTLFLLSDKFNSLAKINHVTVPKLFIHSSSDELVPFSLGKKLYRKAVLPKQFVELTGDHNGAFIESQKKYIEAIKEFIDNLGKTEDRRLRFWERWSIVCGRGVVI